MIFFLRDSSNVNALINEELTLHSTLWYFYRMRRFLGKVLLLPIRSNGHNQLADYSATFQGSGGRGGLL